ncbi:glycosyl hydrolase 43 family protein [Sphingomonas sp. AP4-R1]|uniref:glycoside hydrolase family 43 protein n=1 Tax=Sphingomonas sp. AP4-R1 TaxID=2735134 RepID=UPI0014938EE9|nr:glycoside hydrolase 43 family protein [Sphingomonas sp. AP4-R1]QJU59956.1 glycosyl hydrolase 43 family protein [Sphingomonas sp. AP4-R1]
MRALALSIMLAGGLVAVPAPTRPAEPPRTWTADNGNGTFTNPLFYDEFSDPDLIRVGDWFYLTGTTMHAMPGLPVLRSRDLVNWEFVSYAVDKLDLGPEYRLEGGDRYGRGIWAPSFRYHDGTFYIFSNVNGRTVQIFTAKDPRGPWTQRAMKRSLHDLSVLFDDDGKAYVVWGYKGLHLAQLTPDLTDIVEGTERQIVPTEAGMGEGAHLYKINGKYFITSAWWDGRMRMPAARADTVWGPWEVNPAISIDEDFGLAQGYREDEKVKTPPFAIIPPNPAPLGRVSLHQGGVVQTPLGEWWGFSMMDYNSVGRLLALSPITWKDGWPYFGLPGNLGRTPRTWVKPKTAAPVPIHMPYERSDDFSASTLKPIWQWNHVPVDNKWSLTERSGYLRLHTLPATSFWQARNSLTQRAIGPQSRPTVLLDGSGLQPGDVAGLALLMQPYAWIGLERSASGMTIVQFDQQTGKSVRIPTTASRIWLRADCDYMTEKARFRYSLDGKRFVPFGTEFTMVMQGRTFQGVRYSLFAYNSSGIEGGHADFDAIDLYEPHPHGLTRPIPYGRSITLTSVPDKLGVTADDGKPGLGAPAKFEVVDMKFGRVALKTSAGYLSVAADGSVSVGAAPSQEARSFQWIETPTGELVLMSLVTNRFLGVDGQSHVFRADRSGPQSDGGDGVRFSWQPS